MLALADGPDGAQAVPLRLHFEELVRYVTPRDTLSQLAALYYWWLGHYGFLRDPLPAEMVRTPMAALRDIQRTRVFRGDCDCASTLLTAGARSLGIPARPIRVGFRPPQYAIVSAGVPYRSGRRHGPAILSRRASRLVPYGTPYTHVLVVARDQYGRQVALDPVAGRRTANMLRRTRRFG